MSSIFKPGAPLEEVVRDAPSLARDADIVIVQGGTNNIEKGGINFQPLKKTLLKLGKRRVILCKVPPRFDNTHLGKKTREANRGFDGLKEVKNVSTLDPFKCMMRNHFTRHGLHMNLLGKRLYVKDLARECRI